MSHDRPPGLAIPLRQHRSPAGPLVLAALLFAPSAQAAPGSGPDDYAFSADLHADMRLAEEGDAEFAPPRDPQTGGSQHVIYLNYDGGTISSGGNFESNSQNNTSWVCQSTFTPFGEGQVQDATIQATREDWEAYAVTIVTSRPASGDYTMDMIGSASCGPNNSGVAPIDCGNDNPNDIVFSFANSDAFSVNGVATINSQEIAHSFGLMHVNQPSDIMNPSAGGNNVGFLDECFSIDGNVNCGEQHAAQCGSQSQQNSHAELLALFGPSTPDTVAPTVAITSPTEGQVFSAPAAFDVIAEAQDDEALQELRVVVDGMDQGGADVDAPWSWPIVGVPVGSYTFEVVAIDAAGNETTSNAVTIEVTEAGPEDGGLDDDDDGDGDGETGQDGDGGGSDGAGGGVDDGDGDGDGGDANIGDSGGDDEPGALPDGFGQSSDVAGCACRHERGGLPGSGAAWLLLLGLAGKRVRRPRTQR